MNFSIWEMGVVGKSVNGVAQSVGFAAQAAGHCLEDKSIGYVLLYSIVICDQYMFDVERGKESQHAGRYPAISIDACGVLSKPINVMQVDDDIIAGTLFSHLNSSAFLVFGRAWVARKCSDKISIDEALVELTGARVGDADVYIWKRPL